MRLLIGILWALLLLSCGGRTAPSQRSGDSLAFQYATLPQIVQYDGYTVVTLANPWKAGKVLHRYVLVPSDAPLPEPLPQGTLVRTPVCRAAVFTTVHWSLLTQLGLGDRIVAVADAKYIKIPYVQNRLKSGLITDCGNGLSPMVEKIVETNPDVVMLSPFENSGGYGKVEELGIPLVECAEYMETSPLARAEWMRFYGLLFGVQQQTDSLFAVVDSCYRSLRTLAAGAGQGRSLLVDKMVGSVWYVPGGRSTIGQMVKDACGRYPWADDNHSGSLALPFETVMERGGEAEVWMYRYSSDRAPSYKELLSEHHGYRQLRACREHEVYACNVEQSLFYEESPFRPDYLLADFIQILHPSVSGLPPLRYYQKLP